MRTRARLGRHRHGGRRPRPRTARVRRRGRLREARGAPRAGAHAARGHRGRVPHRRGPARRGAGVGARDTVRSATGSSSSRERDDPIVVSSGFHELIEPGARARGTRARGAREPASTRGPDGWGVRFRDDEPCPVCGEPCKRRTRGSDLGVRLRRRRLLRPVRRDRRRRRVFARDALADVPGTETWEIALSSASADFHDDRTRRSADAPAGS